jgi:hypothetical protein
LLVEGKKFGYRLHNPKFRGKKGQLEIFDQNGLM